jgi:hypothetical protein
VKHQAKRRVLIMAALHADSFGSQIAMTMEIHGEVPRPKNRSALRRWVVKPIARVVLQCCMGISQGLVACSKTSMRTLGGEVVRGRWGRSWSGGGPNEPLAAHGVAVFECCKVGQAGSRCGRKLRIKSLSAASSPEFAGVRAAAQTGRAYPDELGRTAVNCNPNCNPAGSS